MKSFLSLLFLLSTTLAFSQQEASVWYFGQNAGLKFFDDGSVVPLSDGKLITEEGCSSIADSNGNLLFYTDGRTVWDKNHIAMPNGNYNIGTGLLGDPSSTQSGIIVPKPGTPNQYYIFTIDEPHQENAASYPNAFSGTYTDPLSGSVPMDDDGFNNGLNYSLLDLNVTGSNGSTGDIISRNNQLVTYDPNPSGNEVRYKCSEKITAIKNPGSNSYWVITHFTDNFFAFKIDANGVNAIPIISQVGVNQSLLGFRRNGIGYLKASPDGHKIAVAHQQNGSVAGATENTSGCIQILDFDATTGVVSNPVTAISNVWSYGLEFSPSSEKLYATYRIGITPYMTLAQFEVSNPISSKVVIYNTQNILMALQLAPNNKIYCATTNIHALGVINDPDATGLACNYTQASQPLASGTSVKFGLPPFITSFFNAAFTFSNTCFGDATTFSLHANQNILGVIWDFGDGQTSTMTSPNHTYANPGNYHIKATVTSSSGTVLNEKDIFISAIPVANPISNKAVCSSPSQAYDISQHDAEILGAQTASVFEVAYFLSLADAATHSNRLTVNYNLPLGNTILYAKIYNRNHTRCYAVSNFTVSNYLMPVANSLTPIYHCDDASNDGKAIFDLTLKTTELLGTQNPAVFQIKYFKTQYDADNNLNSIANFYQNLTNPQMLFARIENPLHTNCYATTSFEIGLYKMAVANQPQNRVTCDDVSNDGKEIFDLAITTSAILGSQSPLEFSLDYFADPADVISGNNTLPDQYTNTSNPQVIYAKITNKLHPECFATTSFSLVVRESPVLNMKDQYPICDGKPLTLIAPAGFSSYMWSTGSTQQSTTITQTGTYDLTIFQNYGDVICNASKTITVTASNAPTNLTIATTDWTDLDNSIIVTPTGIGNYEYAIDGSDYQANNEFIGLPSGLHTVTVNDINGCGDLSQEVLLLMYPRFFTPNADGYNDYWQIKFGITMPKMDISIFDRFGKLITVLNQASQGWDGTLNGNPLPASDYWFLIIYKGKDIKGHFSLKR